MKVLGFERLDDNRLWRYVENAKPGTLTGIEWSIRKDNNLIGFYVEPYCGHDDKAHVYLALWPVQIWFGFEPRKGDYAPRRTGFSLCWSYWQRWRNADPDGDRKNRVFYSWREKLLDFLFGKTVCIHDRGGDWNVKRIAVEMPEGTYYGTARFEKWVWFRPRWPFRKLRFSTDVDIPKGIPFLGKGENSWDCGDDSLHGYGVDGHDYTKAAEHGAKIVMDRRRKYGEPSTYYPDVPTGGAA